MLAPAAPELGAPWLGSSPMGAAPTGSEPVLPAAPFDAGGLVFPDPGTEGAAPGAFVPGD
jgi:hypothetical protein